MVNLRVLLKVKSFGISEHLVEQPLDFFLRLHPVDEDLAASAHLGELAFRGNVAGDGVVDGHVGQHEPHVFLDDRIILVEIIPKDINQKSYLTCQKSA